MNLFRCFPWDDRVAPAVRGGALWFPRLLQGDGRHDNPGLYGCLYLSAEPVSPVVERLARFRGRPLTVDKLRSSGLPLAFATVSLADDAELVDLDDPHVLEREELRPSRVATSERALTQAYAAQAFERPSPAAGLRWWSLFEALWTNVTLFDRAEPQLELVDVRPLELGDGLVRDAAAFLGLRIAT